MKLTGFQIKVIAIAAMTLDHIGAVFFTANLWMRVPGRICMPIFCFLIAEGFMYTADRKRYASRLFIFALIAEIPFQMCFAAKYGAAGNVFWTLLLGMLALWTCRTIYERMGTRGLALGVLCVFPFCFLACNFPMINIGAFLYDPEQSIFSLCVTDYADKGVIAIFLAGLFHPKGIFFQNQSSILSGNIRLSERSCDIISKWVIQLSLTGLAIWASGTMIPWGLNPISAFYLGPLLGSAVLMLYNGQRGRNCVFAKYLFYVYYPLHLLILGAIQISIA